MSHYLVKLVPYPLSYTCSGTINGLAVGWEPVPARSDGRLLLQNKQSDPVRTVLLGRVHNTLPPLSLNLFPPLPAFGQVVFCDLVSLRERNLGKGLTGEQGIIN